ncbi:MAG TPA: mechanosensitive ion channel protein MscS, partial [Pseudomonas sp.]|nr:mechanosensitive ion channel protein MscS [Pseudomonas sp.]
MDVNIEYLVGLSEAWLPIVLQYSAQLLLALITFLIGWWLINKLTGRLGA